jgi:acetamidase/formamidase
MQTRLWPHEMIALMKTFTRESIHTHCVGADWPDFLGSVEIGEPFVIETERFNLANGPIAVNGVKAGDALAVHVEQVDILPPYYAPNGGPFFEGMGDPQSLELADGYFYYPRHFRLRAHPSVGNIAVLPESTERMRALVQVDRSGWGWRRAVNDPRGKHCHQDCAYLGAGARIHLRSQVDGAGICAADVHAYLCHGEVAFAGIEVNANLRLRVERSTGWLVDWPLIETEDEIMLFCSDTNLLSGGPSQQYVDVVRAAYRAMRAVVAARIQGTLAEANPIVATALDIRNCAIYGLGNYVQKEGKIDVIDQDIAIVACLPKDVFI